MYLVKVSIILLVIFGPMFVFANDQPMSIGTRMVLKMFDECMKDDGFSICLKKKFLTFMDRLNRIDNLSISENIKIIKDNSKKDELLNKISRSFDDNGQVDQNLSSLIVNKIANYFDGRKIEIDLPKIDSSDLSRGLEEGRGKMKKMMGMMMAGAAMKMAAMLPVAIAFLFVLSGKALIVAKIALLLAGILALKKIMQNKAHHNSGWQSSGSGGWDRAIKINSKAHPLAYSAYAPN